MVRGRFAPEKDTAPVAAPRGFASARCSIQLTAVAPYVGAPRSRRCYFFAAAFFAAGFFAAGFFAAGFLAGAAFFAGAFLAGAAFFAGAFFAVAMDPPLPSWCDTEFDSPSVPGGTTADQQNATTSNGLHDDSANLNISSTIESPG